ncbi:diol dehydratase small subunit [Conexibacter stalactiti]|uniref:Diol dehydratase small subunit n=1 Tax=Conexibacter stalactiti TaxID=1940611 RepID=A0ABU4HS66_9ACTN|nr:diol dehydratase small subunit [Conexibacter stalactiti]MDW5596151.1 diol dehydratase small subunit [Conexibacter stalactiti]MEC5036793.1 diol dehydratase small subunit [Conexibacter stalactiti]
MSPASNGTVTAADYPLSGRRPELLRTPSGKTLDDITLEAVLDKTVTDDDLRITPETLELQAQIAEQTERPQMAENLRRAGELTRVPDERLLEIYNSLRPGASSKEQLLSIAEELEGQFQAPVNAALVREAADVYERRDCLAADD